MDSLKKPTPSKPLGIVGSFLRKKREALKISQKELGQKLEPKVTTQFISNVERGVTPLPPAHIASVLHALQIPEQELLLMMEKEYALKLENNSHSVSPDHIRELKNITPLLCTDDSYPFLKQVADFYQSLSAEEKKNTEEAWKSITERFKK